jgi:hypothetical protein
VSGGKLEIAALERLRAALEPFGTMGWYEDEGDDEQRLMLVRIGDVRTAARALGIGVSGKVRRET